MRADCSVSYVMETKLWPSPSDANSIWKRAGRAGWPCQPADACARPCPPRGTRPASCPGHASWHHPLRMSQDGVSGCPQRRCGPQTVSRKGWTCHRSFQASWAKEETVEGSQRPRGGGGSAGRARGGTLSRLAGAAF